MSFKLYQYEKCSTCKKAVKFLDKKAVAYKSIDIKNKPPSKAELKKMLKYVGDIKKLFNTSGIQYRELKIKDKLPSMSEADAIHLLSENGMLVKRPFLLTETNGLVGFKEESWKAELS